MTKKLIAAGALLACATITQIAMVGAQIPVSINTSTEVHGSVTDPSGAVIPGAMVTISTANWSRTVSSDDTGQYAVAAMPPGHYRVRVHFGGFAPYDRSNFVVTQSHETEVNVQLEVRESRQAVTVYE